MRSRRFVALFVLLWPAIAVAGVETTPYGFVLLNSSYNSHSVTDVPVLAPASGAEPNFLMTPRQSRFGIKMKSDAEYTPSGAIEVDFYGLRGSGQPGGPTQTSLRLRRAFFEVHLNKLDILFGQEWVVLSPLNPTTLMHVSLPGMMASGNLWARLPQIRGTFKPLADEQDEVKLDLAFSRPYGSDADMTPVEQGDVLARGEKYVWPWVQGRVGYARKGSTALTVGAGALYGREDFGEDPAGDDIFGTALAVAGDLQLVAGRVTVSGEGFFAKNIRTLFSTAGYTLVPDTLVVGGVRKPYGRFEGIQAVGGWGELKVAAVPELDIAVSAGLEAVDDEFLPGAVLRSEKDAVKSNMTVMGTMIYKGIKGVQIGFEVGYITTDWMLLKKGSTPASTKQEDGLKNLNANLSAMFTF